MGSSVYVAGAGAISGIGNNVAESMEAFETGKAGMGTIRWLNTIHKGKLPVAEVKLSNLELGELSGLSPELSRTALLSAVAALEALADASIPDFNNLRTGFVSATTVGGMDKTENFFPQFLARSGKGRLREVLHHECGSVTELVAARLGISHYVSTISTACSSSANSIFHGARMIRHDKLDVVIAGGTDALTSFTLNGFNSLMILDQEFCQPFDENRRGLNLGEGAGYLVLVSERVAQGLPNKLYGKLSGYCNANDAFHQTASSPEGTGSFLAMKGALEQSGLRPGDISYINLHGTGTQNNDIAEGTAIRILFDPEFPPMSSTKSFTGHTLGASGGLEAVFSVLSIKNGIIFPNLRLKTPMKELPFVPVTRFMKNKKVNHVLSNSFGFGGNCSSLIFSKV